MIKLLLAEGVRYRHITSYTPGAEGNGSTVPERASHPLETSRVPPFLGPRKGAAGEPEPGGRQIKWHNKS